MLLHCWIKLRLGTLLCYSLVKINIERQFMPKTLIIEMVRTFPIIFSIGDYGQSLSLEYFQVISNYKC